MANKQPTLPTRDRSPSLSTPVFVRRNNCFSKPVENEDSLLSIYKENIVSTLTCVGMDNVQISNILAQIDFLLTDEQHERLHHTKILTDENFNILKNSSARVNSALEAQHKTKAAVKVQSHVRGWIVRKRVSQLGKEESALLKIRSRNYGDIIRIEKSFTDTLRMILHKFITPITDNAGNLNISNAAVAHLSGNIKSLLSFHRRLCEKLESLRDHALYPLVLTLGDLLTELSGELRAEYMTFTNNYISAIETLRYLRGNNLKFQTFITKQEANGSTLEVLFEQPLRHLVTLAKRLRTMHSISFPAIDAETMLLGRAIGIVENIDASAGKILNEQQSPEYNENIRKILIVELTLEGLPESLMGTPNRKLLKEGAVRISRKKNQHCQIYIFNDVIVMAEKTLNTLKFVRLVYAAELSVEESGSKLLLKISQGSGKQPLVETLSFKNTRTEKFEWLQHFYSFVETYRKNCVYGTSLATIIEREEIPEKIPFVMVVCTKYIRAFGQTTEGIFRVPGETSKVETFQRLFDSGATEVDFRGCSVHDVATLLKLYLRMLPEPLIPFEYYLNFVKTQSTFDEDQNVDILITQIATTIKNMPSVNRRVFKYLLIFLSDLSQYSKYTMMTSANLALVFAPNIVRPERDTVDTAMQAPIVTRVVESCIVHHKKIWGKAIEMNKEILYEGDEPLPAVNAPNTQKRQLQKVVSRYSMDAFDPLLCNEIPVPGTLAKGPRRPRTTQFQTVKETPPNNEAPTLSKMKGLSNLHNFRANRQPTT